MTTKHSTAPAPAAALDDLRSYVDKACVAWKTGNADETLQWVTEAWKMAQSIQYALTISTLREKAQLNHERETE